MRVLLITSSARGHAIADAFHRSPQHPEIVSLCPSPNPGIRSLAIAQHVLEIMDFDSVLPIAKKYNPDMAFIGPEDPIAGGLGDLLSEHGIPCVAPSAAHARIESSKAFARSILSPMKNASPLFRVYSEYQQKDMYNYIDRVLHGSYVVKYDALKGGKGVKVSGEHLTTIDEGVQYAKSCIQECGQVVIEEKLIGVEFSLLSFVSGSTCIDMPAVQDHKRAFDNDEGPNTGGMGTISDADHSLPFLNPSDLARASEINREVAMALERENGTPYRGILYGGYMAVKDGVRVIEFNARFGDPEALNILPLLESDFVDVCEGILTGDLTSSSVRFAKSATVCKYITPRSYPTGKEERGQPVQFPVIPENARLYLGDVTEQDGQLLLGGSRTAGIVGLAPTIAEAEKIAQSLCEKTIGPVRFRRDIGTQPLIDQRMHTLKNLRQDKNN